MILLLCLLLCVVAQQTCNNNGNCDWSLGENCISCPNDCPSGLGFCCGGASLCSGNNCSQTPCILKSQCRLPPSFLGSDCNDGNPCTTDQCVEGIGCVSSPLCVPLSSVSPCFLSQCSVNVTSNTASCELVYNEIVCPPLANPDKPVFQRDGGIQFFSLGINDNVWGFPEQFRWQATSPLPPGASINQQTGLLTYQPPAHFIGSVSFSYQICLARIGGQCFNQADVTIFVVAATMTTATASPTTTTTSQQSPTTSAITSAPVILGACCNPVDARDSSGNVILCSDNLSVQVCTYVGGAWQGQGSTCLSSSCPLPPATTTPAPFVAPAFDVVECNNSTRNPNCGAPAGGAAPYCPYGYDMDWTCLPKPVSTNCDAAWRARMAALWVRYYRGPNKVRSFFDGMLDQSCMGPSCNVGVKN